MSAVDAHQARRKTNMVDKSEVFSTTVQERLDTAEEELRNQEIDRERVKHALDEMRCLLVPITKRYFSER